MHPYQHIQLIFLVLMTVLSSTTVSVRQVTTEQCNAIIHRDFEKCRYADVDDAPHKGKITWCKNQTICRKYFTISYINLLPYYDWRETVTGMINFCCGNCARLKTMNVFTNFSVITMTSLAGSDFVYPFLAEAKTEMIYGFHFIPMMDAPSVYYITLKTISPRETLLTLVRSTTDLWPFFVISLCLAMVIGSIVWSMETWNNEKQFARQFYVGVLDGFWWAFVSMTTVGYGDKIPKSWPSRVVSIGWILVGISISSIFTAALTSSIINVITPVIPQMTGKRVGWLRHRLYEATVIAHHKGYPIGITDENYVSGISKLFKMLGSGEIEGFVLDRYIYNLFKIKMEKTANELYDIADLFYNSTEITEIQHTDSYLTFGMLVRHRHDHKYFEKYMKDNQLQTKTCNTLRLNSIAVKKKMEVNIFSLEAGLFWTSFAVTVAILVGILAFGVLYEAVRLQVNCYQKLQRRKKEKEEEWIVRNYTHTEYKQKWIDVRNSKRGVIGTTKKAGASEKGPGAKDLKRNELEKELKKQNIDVLFLKRYDVLIFNEISPEP